MEELIDLIKFYNLHWQFGPEKEGRHRHMKLSLISFLHIPLFRHVVVVQAFKSMKMK